MSRPPKRSTTSATAARTELSSPTSQRTPTSGAGTSACKSRLATVAPRSASIMAVARPMPDAPPVTIARSPANSLVVMRANVMPARGSGARGQGRRCRVPRRHRVQVPVPVPLAGVNPCRDRASGDGDSHLPYAGTAIPQRARSPVTHQGNVGDRSRDGTQSPPDRRVRTLSAGCGDGQRARRSRTPKLLIRSSQQGVIPG